LDSNLIAGNCFTQLNIKNGTFDITQSGGQSRFKIDCNGNASIGTTTALKSKFTIEKRGTIAGVLCETTLHVGAPSSVFVGDYQQIGFGPGGFTYSTAYIGYVVTNSQNRGYGDLVFGTRCDNTDSTGPVERMRIFSTGESCFSGTVCAPRLQVFNTNSIVVIEGTATNGEGTLTIAGKNSSGTSRSAIFKYDNADVIRISTADAIPMRFETSDVTRMTISSTGISTFTCQVCSPSFVGGASSGTCAIFNTLTAGNTSGASVNITTNGNNGTSESPLQTNLNFRGLNNNLNGQIRVDDISGTVQIGSMQFYTWNSGQVSALTLCHNSSAIFYGQVSAPKLYACTTSDAAITIDGYSKLSFKDRGTEYGTINASRYNFGGESTLFTFQSDKCFLFLNGTNCLMFIGSNGNVGINETTPSAPLHFSKQTNWGSSTNRVININNTGTGGDINQPHNMGSITWYSGNDTPTAEIAAYRNTPASGNNIELRFYTATVGTPLERMRITSTGLVGFNTTNFGERLNIGCGGAIGFQNTCNCQRWHIQYRGAEDGLNFVESAVADFRLFLKAGGNVGIGTGNPSAPLTIRCDASSQSAIMEIATCFQNAYRYASINAGAGISYCIPGGTSQSPFFEVQGGDSSAGGGSFRIRTGAMGSVTDKVNIAQNGVACFASTLCAANLSTQGFIRANGAMKTFSAQKNFDERVSNADFFRISGAGGSGFQVVVYSVSQNGAVGWSQSQVFQAVTAPYWGGWTFSSTAVSTIGSGSPMITSAVSGGDGTITFRVSTGNNGTTTEGTIQSFIQVNGFNIDLISITVF
jgi:hypothetical protein